MDMRTGRLYESAEEARAAGVPESDIAEIDAHGKLVKFFRESIKVRENPAYPGGAFQGERERARRLAHQLPSSPEPRPLGTIAPMAYGDVGSGTGDS